MFSQQQRIPSHHLVSTAHQHLPC